MFVTCQSSALYSSLSIFVSFFLFLSLIVTLTSSTECLSNQDYVKIIKKTKDNASKESFRIVSGSSVLFSSPQFSDNQEYLYELCLNASSNHIYTLVMSDTSWIWASGSWIAMDDINDNTVFKALMGYGREERYQFALYSPIKKNDEWRFSDSYHSGWNMNSFNHSEWTAVNLGSHSLASSYTQYFRKSFRGIRGMASMNIELYYREGIIVYMNGIIVYKDKMPEGLITPSTLASDSYSFYAYRGIIIPSFYGESDECVIAVELHFTSFYYRTIEFNCFISYASGISESNPCSVYPHSISASTDKFTNPSQAFDFYYSYVTLVSKSSLSAYIMGSFTNVIPLINSIRLYTYYDTAFYPSSFTVSGGNSKSYSWTDLLTQSGQTYSQFSWKQWSFNTPFLLESIKFTVHSVQSTDYAYIHELQFMVCNHIAPLLSFSYPQTAYILTIFSSFLIIPSIRGYNPYYSIESGSLPQGLSLDSPTGIISGTPSQPVSSQSVTIKATNGGSSLYFTLTFTVRIQISSFSYSQSHFILTRYHPFSISPSINGYNPFYAIESGSLPQGLSLDPYTGVISGIPSQSVSNLSVIIKATNEVSYLSISISFSVQFISSFLIYPQSSYSLTKGLYFATAPLISGDNPVFILLGTLPQGLKLDRNVGRISGIPSTTSDIIYVTIQASNQVGSIQTQLSFVVNPLSTTAIVLISLVDIFIIIIIIILIIIRLKRKTKKYTLSKKSPYRTKSVERNIDYSYPNQSPYLPHPSSYNYAQSNIAIYKENCYYLRSPF